MRVFLTGATGFIGSAIVQELLGAGHQVIGLARSDSAAQALTAAGAQVQRGALDDLDSLRHGARLADGVIHTAFIHDFSQYEASARIDRRAVEAIASALEGSNKPFVSTSGTLSLARGRVVTEADLPEPNAPAQLRGATEAVLLGAAQRGVRTSFVRLPPSVHGDGDHGFVPALIATARAKGLSAYVGDGQNRWPAVHRLDAAHLFRLALERAPAGSTLHGVGDVGVPFLELARTIGARLNVPVVSQSPAEALAHFGFLGAIAAADCPASSVLTQALLDWHPKRPGLIADLDREAYFS